MHSYGINVGSRSLSSIDLKIRIRWLFSRAKWRLILFIVIILADFSRNCQPIYPAGTNLAFSHAYSTSSLTSNYFNSNNNNNILDVQSLYTSLPLNQFTTPNHYVYSSSKAIEPVCQTPSTGSSLSSFDELPPPVKPRYSIRPQLPPPPPPPTAAPNFLNSTLTWQGPTRPAPKPPVQSISRKDSIQFRSISNPFERHLYNDDRNSIRDSCDVETSSTRTDFFGLELENLQSKMKRFFRTRSCKTSVLKIN